MRISVSLLHPDAISKGFDIQYPDLAAPNDESTAAEMGGNQWTSWPSSFS